MTVRPSGANRAKSATAAAEGELLERRLRLLPQRSPGEHAESGEGRCASHGGDDAQPSPAPRRRHRGGDGLAARAKGLERERHVARRLEAVLPLLLEAVADDAVEPRRHLQLRRELLRLLLQDRVQRLHRRVAVERPAARQHLVEHRPEGEDVGAVVRRLAPRLLRGHVADRPQHHARRRLPRQRGRSRVLAVRDDRLQREAEVQDLDDPVLRDEQVLGLQVPVDDRLVVRRGEPVRHLQRVVHGLARGDRARPQALAQRLALEQLGDEVGSALVVPHVVDDEDVRVVEEPGGAGLVLEAVAARRVGGDARRQHLDRHRAPEARIAGAVHLAHPPGPQAPEDLVRPDVIARVEGHPVPFRGGRWRG